MNFSIRPFFFTLALLFALNTQAQTLKVPAPSPSQTLKQAFALSEITIEYSRPSAKGRVIFGDLVPYGKIWRTGANNSTQITFGENVKVNGKDISAGTYALYTMPGKDAWEVMLYKDLKLGGDVAEYKTENEVARFTVKPSVITEKVETFTILISNMSSKSANIDLCWENTKVTLSVEADIDATIMKNIETVLSKDARPYYAAANYYYENNKDLNKALEWANKAVENNPKAYWQWLLKAKIHMKLNDKKAATEAANKVKELATADQNDDYVKMADKILNEAK